MGNRGFYLLVEHDAKYTVTGLSMGLCTGAMLQRFASPADRSLVYLQRTLCVGAVQATGHEMGELG